MEPFIAQIMMFGGNFAPRGWAFCDGQLLPISQNQALFSLIGTIYGGDGRTTFALPDLRGRAPIHPGSGPGLTPRKVGQRIGTEYNVLNITQLPSHNHAAAVSNINVGVELKASSAAATTQTPVNGASLAAGNEVTGRTTSPVQIYNEATPDITLNGVTSTAVGGTVTVGNTGGNQAVNNMQPSLGLNYIIALQGIFPSRS
ncbi:MAG: phage tail protein [Polaribacter sp.]